MTAGKPVIVLGAGCAGLAAAYRLQSKGVPVVVVEALDRVGGLAGGVKIAGNTYEYGPHVFHTTDPEILADVKGLMGEDLKPFHRTVQIKFLGSYFQFPLSMGEVLFKLPKLVVLKAALSFAYRFVEGALSTPAVETSETVLRRFYGDVLYEIFFADYITRVWGIPPSGFSPNFARERIPRLNFVEILSKIAEMARAKLRGPARTGGYVEKVEGNLYSTREGFSMITQRMADRLAEKGGRVLLNAMAVRIMREGARASGVVVRKAGADETLECAALVNTLPVNEAVLCIEPPLDERVQKAARELRFRATIFVGIKAKRPKVLQASFMYLREHSFNRITDLSYFGHHIEPPGTTLLVAEVNCDPSDKLWTDDALVKEKVIADLEREKILPREEIAELHLFRSRHAYPMYTLGYERALETVLNGLGTMENFETAGRQGRFQYVNTHIAMKMGYEAADRLLSRLARA